MLEEDVWTTDKFCLQVVKDIVCPREMVGPHDELPQDREEGELVPLDITEHDMIVVVEAEEGDEVVKVPVATVINQDFGRELAGQDAWSKEIIDKVEHYDNIGVEIHVMTNTTGSGEDGLTLREVRDEADQKVKKIKRQSVIFLDESFHQKPASSCMKISQSKSKFNYGAFPESENDGDVLEGGESTTTSPLEEANSFLGSTVLHFPAGVPDRDQGLEYTNVKDDNLTVKALLVSDLRVTLYGGKDLFTLEDGRSWGSMLDLVKMPSEVMNSMVMLEDNPEAKSFAISVLDPVEMLVPGHDEVKLEDNLEAEIFAFSKVARMEHKDEIHIMLGGVHHGQDALKGRVNIPSHKIQALVEAKEDTLEDEWMDEEEKLSMIVCCELRGHGGGNISTCQCQARKGTMSQAELGSELIVRLDVVEDSLEEHGDEERAAAQTVTIEGNNAAEEQDKLVNEVRLVVVQGSMEEHCVVRADVPIPQMTASRILTDGFCIQVEGIEEGMEPHGEAVDGSSLISTKVNVEGGDSPVLARIMVERKYQAWVEAAVPTVIVYREDQGQDRSTISYKKYHEMGNLGFITSAHPCAVQSTEQGANRKQDDVGTRTHHHSHCNIEASNLYFTHKFWHACHRSLAMLWESSFSFFTSYAATIIDVIINPTDNVSGDIAYLENRLVEKRKECHGDGHDGEAGPSQGHVQQLGHGQEVGDCVQQVMDPSKSENKASHTQFNMEFWHQYLRLMAMLEDMDITDMFMEIQFPIVMHSSSVVMITKEKGQMYHDWHRRVNGPSQASSNQSLKTTSDILISEIGQSNCKDRAVVVAHEYRGKVVSRRWSSTSTCCLGSGLCLTCWATSLLCIGIPRTIGS